MVLLSVPRMGNDCTYAENYSEYPVPHERPWWTQQSAAAHRPGSGPCHRKQQVLHNKESALSGRFLLSGVGSTVPEKPLSGGHRSVILIPIRAIGAQNHIGAPPSLLPSPVARGPTAGIDLRLLTLPTNFSAPCAHAHSVPPAMHLHFLAFRRERLPATGLVLNTLRFC